LTLFTKQMQLLIFTKTSSRGFSKGRLCIRISNQIIWVWCGICWIAARTSFWHPGFAILTQQVLLSNWRIRQQALLFKCTKDAMMVFLAKNLWELDHQFIKEACYQLLVSHLRRCSQYCKRLPKHVKLSLRSCSF